jgi:hypothetical protein
VASERLAAVNTDLNREFPHKNEIFPSCDSHREILTDGGDRAYVEPSVVALMWVKIAVGIESGDNRVATGDPQTCSYNLPVTHITAQGDLQHGVSKLLCTVSRRGAHRMDGAR